MEKKFFLTYYLVCGIGSAVIYFLCVKLYVLFGGDSAVLSIPVVGASGAIFGLLLAYGLIYGERIILFMFFVPMRARTFTIVIAAVELLSVLNTGLGGSVANLAHLGGLLSGFLFLFFRKKLHSSCQLQGFYSMLFHRWKKNRLKVMPDKDDMK